MKQDKFYTQTNDITEALRNKKCEFDNDGICISVICLESNKKCSSRKENGCPNYNHDIDIKEAKYKSKGTV